MNQKIKLILKKILTGWKKPSKVDDYDVVKEIKEMAKLGGRLVL